MIGVYSSANHAPVEINNDQTFPQTFHNFKIDFAPKDYDPDSKTQAYLESILASRVHCLPILYQSSYKDIRCAEIPFDLVKLHVVKYGYIPN